MTCLSEDVAKTRYGKDGQQEPHVILFYVIGEKLAKKGEVKFANHLSKLHQIYVSFLQKLCTVYLAGRVGTKYRVSPIVNLPFTL